MAVTLAFGATVERRRPRTPQIGQNEGEYRVLREYAYFGVQAIPTVDVCVSLEPLPKVPNTREKLETEHLLQDKVRILEEQLAIERSRSQQLELQLVASSQVTWNQMQTIFQQELDALHKAAGPVTSGPANKDLLATFSFQQLNAEFLKYAPQLTNTIQSLGRHPGSSRDNLMSIHSLAALSILSKKGDDKLKALQLLLSLMTVARSVSKRVFETFNHLGLTLSYTQTWEYVRKFAAATERASQLKEATWIVAYDNINIHKRVMHERMCRHEAWDFTSRLALKVKNTPPPEWQQTAALPQKHRSELQPDELMPNDDDESLFTSRACRKVMEILVTKIQFISPSEKGHT